MIKYNDDNIYVGQIKQLLNEFNLPQCEVYRESRKYVEGQHYIKGSQIFVIEDGKSKFVTSYNFGDYIPNITKNLKINSNIYDEYTHKYLGDYLRFIKEYKHVDLMSMYNCFTYEIPTNLNLKIKLNNQKEIVFDTKDKNYNIFMLPVKFNEKYTIGIDCNSDIYLTCGFYSNNNFIETEDFTAKSLVKKSGIRFNKPFIYEVGNFESKDLFEKDLKLFIKIPSFNNSSITILEGDYEKCCDLYINDEGEQVLGNKLFEYKVYDEETGKYSQLMGNYEYLNKPQLLSYNLGIKYLLSDRLVEYLSNNAIYPLDDVEDNIKRLQIRLNEKGFDLSLVNYGEWDESMRRMLYRYLNKQDTTSKFYDMLSYCDKDVEKMLGSLPQID